MKDRIEFRFTVATGKINGNILKALKPAIKIATPYLERLAEAVVKNVESESDKNVRRNNENWIIK